MQRRGHTLIELVIVLALLGILLGLAVPHLTASLDGIHAGQAATRIALAHGRARAMALGEQRVARVRLTGDSLVVLVGDSVRWRVPGPAMDGAASPPNPRRRLCTERTRHGCGERPLRGDAGRGEGGDLRIEVGTRADRQERDVTM